MSTHHNPRGEGAVDGDTLDHGLGHVWRDVAVVGRDLAELLADVGLHDRHAVGGERARLVGADGGRVAHGLARVQVTDQVVVFHHFLGIEE